MGGSRSGSASPFDRPFRLGRDQSGPDLGPPAPPQPGRRPKAILLDTPFGFEENAERITARIVTYYRDHVGCDLRLASFRHREQATPPAFEHFLARLDQANYVFAGPGSPTYALRHWRDPAVRRRLARKVTHGGCIAFASAAAISLGAYALPVYEIYKVGEDPFWAKGLDILGEIGVRCTVVPHFNNREGGTHDTRFCFMGEARLRRLESMLPEDVLILGIDEHTACVIDVDAQSVTVCGRGGVTVRHRAWEQRWEGSTFPLDELKDFRARLRPLRPRPTEAVTAAPAKTSTDVLAQFAPLVDLVLALRAEARREERFGDADRYRRILVHCGVDVQDTPSGTAWSLAHA